MLIFSILKAVFYYFFCFSIQKIIDFEYSKEGYKSPKINIGAVIKSPEKLKFVPDHLKTKQSVLDCYD